MELKIAKEELRLLDLSKKEMWVLLGIQNGFTTPLTLLRHTKISRPAIYSILKKLKDRGLVISRITNGRKHWQLRDERSIEETLYDAKRALLKIPKGREEVHGLSDSTVVVHRGAEACKKLVGSMVVDHKNERLHAFQGNVSSISWNKVFTVKETNAINRDIKKNGIIAEGILPLGWFEKQIKELGVEWAKGFEGRTTQINVIEPEYFKHGGQMWVFKKSLYLMSLSEELIIEIRNSEIQKMILSIFEFIQDNSRTVDGNSLLRELIERYGKKA